MKDSYFPRLFSAASYDPKSGEEKEDENILMYYKLLHMLYAEYSASEYLAIKIFRETK